MLIELTMNMFILLSETCKKRKAGSPLLRLVQDADQDGHREKFGLFQSVPSCNSVVGLNIVVAHT